MKFQFAFEKVWAHRKREEELAVRDFLIAKSNFEAGLGALGQLRDSIIQTRRLASQALMSGQASSARLNQMDLFIAGQQWRIKEQKAINRELEQEMEEKQKVAVERAQAAKVLEKLRERQLARHKLALRKKEAKEADDLITMRFRIGANDDEAPGYGLRSKEAK